MPTINYSVTQSIDTLAVNLSASEALVMNINNPLVGASYFGLETIPNSDGIYTSASPKNTSGSFTMGAGILGVVKDDYKMSAVVSPGDNVLTFIPALAVTGSTLRTRGIASPPISGFDVDALAFFTRVATAGGTLSTTEQTAVNQLVIDMKSTNIWDAMKAIYPMVGASAAACAQNLKSSSFTGTFSSGWTFASTGVTPNGTSAFMNTGLNDLNDLGTNATIGVYLNASGALLWDLGVYNGSLISGISVANATSNNYINIRSALAINFTESFTGGLYVGTDNGSTVDIYKNATNKATTSQVHNGLNLVHYVGCLNNNGTPFLFSGKRNAFTFFANANFTSTNITNLNSAVQAFQTTLSRNV